MAGISNDGNIDVHRSNDISIDKLKEDFRRLNLQTITEHQYIQHRKSNIPDSNILQLDTVMTQDIEACRNLLRHELEFLSDKEYENAVEAGRSKANLMEENNRKKRFVEKNIQRFKLPAMQLTKSFDLNLQLNIVVIGKTGNGKSATANVLLGEDGLVERRKFKERPGTISLTEECEVNFSEMGGLTIKIIDTPGLFDTKLPFEKALKAISEIITASPDGIHAFLFVVNVHARFTEDELKTLREVKLHFGDKFDEHSMLVFTHGNRIIEDGKTLKTVCDEIQQNGAESKTFIDAFGNRIVAVENKSTVPAIQRRNRQSLISLALSVSENGSKIYTNELFKVAQEIKKTIRLSELAEQISQLILEELKRDALFIYKVDNKEVPDQFTESVRNHLSSKGLQYSSDEIKHSTLEVMERQKQVFDSVFKAIATKMQIWKRRCVII